MMKGTVRRKKGIRHVLMGGSSDISKDLGYNEQVAKEGRPGDHDR